LWYLDKIGNLNFEAVEEGGEMLELFRKMDGEL